MPMARHPAGHPAPASAAGVKGGELPSIQHGQLFMCHPTYRVFYSNFSLCDIVSGSLIECRNPFYQQAVQVHGISDAISKVVPARSSTIGASGQLGGVGRGMLYMRAQALLQSGDGWSR